MKFCLFLNGIWTLNLENNFLFFIKLNSDMTLWVFSLQEINIQCSNQQRKASRTGKSYLFDSIFTSYVSFLCSAAQITKCNTEKWFKTSLIYISGNIFQDLTLKNNVLFFSLLQVRLFIIITVVHQIVFSSSLIQLFIKHVKNKIHYTGKDCFAVILTENKFT